MTTTERIHAELKKQGRSGAELCRSLGIGQNLMASWKDYPPTKYLAEISRFLNVTTDYLLTGIEKEPTTGETPRCGSRAQAGQPACQAAKLAELRADPALTARIEEVAQEVYDRAERQGGKG